MNTIDNLQKEIESIRSELIEKTRILDLRKKVFWKDKPLEIKVEKLNSEIWKLRIKIIKMEKWINKNSETT